MRKLALICHGSYAHCENLLFFFLRAMETSRASFLLVGYKIRVYPLNKYIKIHMSENATLQVLKILSILPSAARLLSRESSSPQSRALDPPNQSTTNLIGYFRPARRSHFHFPVAFRKSKSDFIRIIDSITSYLMQNSPTFSCERIFSPC